jgi:ABC-2 type transport system ATP-binding protein
MHNAITLSFKDSISENVCNDIEKTGLVERVEIIDNNIPAKLRIFPRDRKSILTSISDVVKEKKWDVEQIHVEHGRLDEVFRKITIDS